MLLLASYYGDIVQVALTCISAILMVISVNAYRRRRDGRYLLLMLAFVFLCVGAVSTTLLELSVGAGPSTVELMALYLNPSLELMTGLSFLAALLWSSKARRRTALAFTVTVIAVALVASAAYVSSDGGVNIAALSALPAGCVRPVGGFLIVGSSLGYNDSIAHGAPVRPWPILDVSNGSSVTITVCNEYAQALGFQVVHYLDDQVEAIGPGQAITVNFLADETGTFLIYCSVLSPIHVYLQGGELNVASGELE